MRILRITLWSIVLRGLMGLALLASPGSAMSASRTAAPLVLVETRPLETSLGDPSLPTTTGEWLDMIGAARATLDLLVQRLEEARREIVVQSLNYGVAGFGSRDSTLHQALIAAARRGVKVRLLISDWELGNPGEADLKALALNPNVEVRISRIPDWSGGYIPFARVDHCKYAVTDSSWLWLGTSNWEPSYFLTARNVGLTVHHGDLGRAARRVFDKTWSSTTAIPFGPEAQLVPRPHGVKPPDGATVYGE